MASFGSVLLGANHIIIMLLLRYALVICEWEVVRGLVRGNICTFRTVTYSNRLICVQISITCNDFWLIHGVLLWEMRR